MDQTLHISNESDRENVMCYWLCPPKRSHCNTYYIIKLIYMFLLIIVYLFHSWHSPNIGLHTEHRWAIWRPPVHTLGGCWPFLCSWRHSYSAPPLVRGTFQTLHGSALASAPIKLTWCNQSPSKSFTCYNLSE